MLCCGIFFKLFYNILPKFFSGNQGVTKGISKAFEKEWRVSKDSGSTAPMIANAPPVLPVTPRNWKMNIFYTTILLSSSRQPLGWWWVESLFITLFLGPRDHFSERERKMSFVKVIIIYKYIYKYTENKILLHNTFERLTVKNRTLICLHVLVNI